MFQKKKNKTKNRCEEARNKWETKSQLCYSGGLNSENHNLEVSGRWNGESQLWMAPGD